MKKIVILGGGFGGLNLAKLLGGRVKGGLDAEITLVDFRDYHEFHADLYEIATSPEDLTTLPQLAYTAKINFSEALKGLPVNTIKGQVTEVNLQDKVVRLGERSVDFDYLVYALGSHSAFYGIPGAEEHGLTFKTIQDALRIRNKLEFVLNEHRQDVTKYNLRIVVAGGGFAGVELAAEMTGFLDFLCWKNQYPREKVEIEIIEAGNKILCNMPDKAIKYATQRLLDLGVHVSLNSHITEVTSSSLSMANGERINYDCLVWTTGVLAKPVSGLEGLEQDRSGRILVNENLQATGFPNVFIIGDSGLNLQLDPPTAQHSVYQAEYLAKVLPDILKNKKVVPYTKHSTIFVITMGRKQAMLLLNSWVFKGLFVYVVRVGITFKYYFKLVGLLGAVKAVATKLRLYSKND